MMEAVRPRVDLFLLDFLKSRAFKKTLEGICRMVPPVTRQLMTTGPPWARELGTVVEHSALKLFDSKSRLADLGNRSLRRIPTVLTQANRNPYTRYVCEKIEHENKNSPVPIEERQYHVGLTILVHLTDSELL
jgi:hypothetical protein